MRNWIAGVAAALTMVTTPASAEWYEASGTHFVIYADAPEASVRRLADYLERYHQTILVLTGLHPDEPSPSNRVTIYSLPGMVSVDRLFGPNMKGVPGFYLAKAGETVAFVPRARAVSDANLSDEFQLTVLLHEYAHHVLNSNSSVAAPLWVSEGGAEFFAQTVFRRDGIVQVGNVPSFREWDMHWLLDVSVRELLDPAEYAKRGHKFYDGFYGKSWLLYHYLTFEPARAGQMQAYLAKVAEGVAPVAAAELAFGDLDRLYKDVDRYLLRPGFRTVTLSGEQLRPQAIAVRQLGAGEAAIMTYRIRLARGLPREQENDVLSAVRKLARKYPTDPAVLGQLALAERIAGNDQSALAAAGEALRFDPDNIIALEQQGMALFHVAAATAPATDAAKTAWAQARKPFLRLNYLENDNPLPLIYNYRIALGQGRPPSANAISGMEYALVLAPFDQALRMEVALMEARNGQAAKARTTLLPIVNSPHESDLKIAARDIIARIDADPHWNGSGYKGPDSGSDPRLR